MNSLTLVHVAGGSVALAAGAAALAVRKGGRPHAVAGTAFVAAMLAMGATAAVLAPQKAVPDRVTLIGGVFVCYLVATGWAAARRRHGRAGRLEAASAAVAAACAAGFLALGVEALNSPTGRVDGFAPAVPFANGALAALAAALDIRFLGRGALTGAQRVRRHLWRMATALTMASGAFFLGQQDLMPAAVRGSSLLALPVLAPLVLTAFWLLRPAVARLRRGVVAAEMLRRVFPAQLGDDFPGYRAALWLFGLFVGLRLTMSVNTMLNTRSVATGGDGLPPDGPVLLLVALLALSQLVPGLLGLVALVKYKALVPLLYLLLLAEMGVRRAVVTLHPVERADGTPVGFYVNLGLLALLVAGFALSVLGRPRAGRPDPGHFERGEHA